MTVIDVKNVTKEYKLGELKGLKQTAKGLLKRISGNKEAITVKRHKALNNLNFNIKAGEVVGIIGSNGAGKSTLLKLLSKITLPTRGNIEIHGSVAPLIEVGAGLNPQLTGRENIFLNGSILGLSRKKIKRILNEIISLQKLKNLSIHRSSDTVQE